MNEYSSNNSKIQINYTVMCAFSEANKLRKLKLEIGWQLQNSNENSSKPYTLWCWHNFSGGNFAKASTRSENKQFLISVAGKRIERVSILFILAFISESFMQFKRCNQCCPVDNMYLISLFFVCVRFHSSCYFYMFSVHHVM